MGYDYDYERIYGESLQQAVQGEGYYWRPVPRWKPTVADLPGIRKEDEWTADHMICDEETRERVRQTLAARRAKLARRIRAEGIAEVEGLKPEERDNG